MIDIVVDSWTMAYKPIPDHYHKYAGKTYQSSDKTGLGFGATVTGNRKHPAGRHPYNVITMEVLDD